MTDHEFFGMNGHTSLGGLGTTDSGTGTLEPETPSETHSFYSSETMYSDERSPLLGLSYNPIGNYSEKSSIIYLGKSASPKGESPTAKGSSTIAAFFSFAKTSMGSGSFALPWAISQSGVIFGSFGFILIGVVSVYTQHLILECKNFATSNHSPQNKRKFTYNDIGRAAFGTIGKLAVDFDVLLCNLGVCASYVIFVSSNLQWSSTCFAEREEDPFTKWSIYGYLIPIFIVLTFLPSFKYLAYAAYVGLGFLAVAMGTIYWYGIERGIFEGANHDEIVYGAFSLTRIPKFFGVAAFQFCVHAMVIPIECGMKKPDRMKYLVDAACFVALSVNIPFAVYGYLLFGNETKGYIFENMPGTAFDNVVRLLLSIELSLTFPIIFKPVSLVVEEWMETSYATIKNKYGMPSFMQAAYKSSFVWYTMVCIMRTLLVLIAWSVAILIPEFQLAIAFVGGLAATTLAFVMPPLFHLKLMWNITRNSRKLLHMIILIFGIAAGLITTGVNVQAIVTHNANSTEITC